MKSHVKNSLAGGFTIALFVFATTTAAAESRLTATLSAQGNEIHVTRSGETQPLVTQVAKPDFRPYLHPMVAPDGKGQLTEFSPGHHKHQTGLYWGFTRLNGRDYFHHPEGRYWKRVSATVVTMAFNGRRFTICWTKTATRSCVKLRTGRSATTETVTLST